MLRRGLAAAVLLATCATSCELVLDLPPAANTGGGHPGGSSSSSGHGGDGAASSVSSSASSTAATGGAGGGCCDCDGDGHNAIGPCGGDDCDDANAFAYPKEKVYYAMPDAKVGFDWDCNGVPERDPELTVTVNCAELTPPCTSPPKGAYLMATPPACGDTGPWGTCVPQGLLCVESVIDQALPMKCK